MAILTEQNRILVMDDIRKQPYAARLTEDEIERALESIIEIFSKYEHHFTPVMSIVSLRTKDTQIAVNYSLELIPAIVDAHRFFGNSLPNELKQKLTNPTQTYDTLFELRCLGAFQPFHKVQYEPTLSDGKVPDLKLLLTHGVEVYVECKSQHIMGSNHYLLFDKICKRIQDILDVEQSTFVKKAWGDGLRSEVRLTHTPTNADINELCNTIENYVPIKNMPTLEFGKSIRLSLVPREQPFDKNLPPPSGRLLADTISTDLTHFNIHSAVYPWSGLDAIQRRSQRKLLASARHKLRGIPSGTFGLICIQTFSHKKFAPDIHRLIQQKEFKKIPMVWLNPIGPGRVISRNDALDLRYQIFAELFKQSR